MATQPVSTLSSYKPGMMMRRRPGQVGTQAQGPASSVSNLKPATDPNGLQDALGRSPEGAVQPPSQQGSFSPSPLNVGGGGGQSNVMMPMSGLYGDQPLSTPPSPAGGGQTPDYGSLASSLGMDPNQPFNGNAGSTQTPQTNSAPNSTPGAPPSVSAGNNPYSSGSWNPFNSRDVYDQNQGFAQENFQQGQDWKNNYGQLADYYNNQQTQTGQTYQNQLNQFAAGNGGYNQDQQNNIVRNSDYDSIQGQQQDNYLTPGETQSITGNPYAAQQLFQGQANNLSQQAAAGSGLLMGAANNGTAAGGDILNQYKQSINSSINPTNLSLSAGYKPGIDSRLATGAGQLNAAQSDPGLSVTNDYLKQAGMSDQEVQDASEAAARTVGAQYGATKDELIQNARASGTASPLAIASAEGSLDRSSAADQADAVTQARLGARQQQRDAASGIQQTQLNAGQYKAGLGSQNALAEQNAGISADTTAEQLRLAANSNLSNTQLSNSNLLAGMGLQNNQNNTTNSLNAINEGVGYGLNTGEYNASELANLTQTGEQNQSNRAATIAQNRQGVNQSNQQMNYNIAGQKSNQYQQAYAPGVQGMTTALQGEGNLQQYYGNQGNAQGQLALGGWQTANTGINDAANNYEKWGINEANNGGVAGAIKNTTGLINAVSGAGNSAANVNRSNQGRAKGGLIDHHQLIEVGEHDRPEMILPLDPATPPQHRNKYEKLGASLGHRMGIKTNPDSFIGHPEHLPKVKFATGGIIGFNPDNLFADNDRTLEHVEDTDEGDMYPGYKRGGLIGAGNYRMRGVSMPPLRMSQPSGLSMGV